MSVGQALDRHVVVCGTECSLVVSHVSKSVWIAGGEFGGSRVTSKGASVNAAVLAWKRDIEAVHKAHAAPLPPPPKPRKRVSGPMTRRRVKPQWRINPGQGRGRFDTWPGESGFGRRRSPRLA